MATRRGLKLPFRRAPGSGGSESTDPTEAKRERAMVDYLLRFQPHCDRHLSRLASPKGRTVLVIGCGNGTEMLWAIREGAAEVVGIDISEKSTRPLEMALSKMGIDKPPPFEMVQLGVDDVAQLDRRFDLVLSNNTFEHLPDIRNAFKAIRSVVEPKDGRVAIFTDPLYHSSHGSHLPIEPWAHLHEDEETLEASTDQPHVWHAFKTLNEMTLISFLEAIREADWVILELFIVSDRDLDKLSEVLPRIAGKAPVTDLALEGIGVALMPPPAP